MVHKSKLKLALAAEKGLDYRKIKEKRKVKANLKEKEKKKAEKAKRYRGDDSELQEDDEEWQDDEGSDEDEVENALFDMEAEESDDDEGDDDKEINLGNLEDSETDSESEVEMEAKIIRPKKSKDKKETKDRTSKKAKPAAAANDDDEEDEEEDEDDEDIPMSDLEDLPEDDKSDLVPHQRLTINNTTALLAALKRIALPTDGTVPFATHMCVTPAPGTAPTEASIPDVSDDLARELALYKQSLDAAKRARQLLRAEGVPFTRPGDYFAEMVKPDEHMEKVKAKLVEDATAKKAAAEARKLRDLKKFGKQVQVAKLQERAKAKKDTLEKIKDLKRKRQEGGSSALGEREADIFDVGVENELKKPSGGKRNSAFGDRNRDEPNRKRQKKNDKYGFGGKKKYSKSGDAMSSGDLSGFSVGRMKGKGGKGPRSAPRPGKSKRVAMASKRR
ncbi:rRNA processing protein Ebp2 [Pyricularia oryzae 70-15]|uniref:rRNA processing protein Ebp2 n=3 Tax=Pyricularia oryzae TaxID=318829 RepID=G4MRW1_PYRO7|nr:rRNA processing protein Ebp2 [Pyricularia oryzae 70-15]EHA56630.1 rRNA processing protein Ebp2 [Pyricularia oryzae 70-15]ELQ35146.1 rRNA processing protein Ebp2 [Pyricularia oryzae Y34]KAI7930115.1 rRNA processing protein Ebp2 [Pyricularia oryzae]KAI7930274.1 rRNA processing protein Ebp2 [Pyricularia oryzae]